MNQTDALVNAGYSVETANKSSKKIIQHPQVQSILTEAVERVLAEEQKQFDDIVRPYVKALGANVVVKMPTIGDAVETKIPDHATRMDAATHIARLYQPKNVDEEAEKEKSGPPVLYQINFIEAGAKAPAPVVISGPRPAQSDNVPPVPEVAFVSRKR